MVSGLTVGREVELDRLQRCLQAARDGHRQFVCITGEPGIGKTTIVEAFLNRLARSPEVRIASGQCVEHFGTGEAYRPILEALGRLCRSASGTAVVALLRQYAPTWLGHLPGFLTEAEYDRLQQRLLGITRERMLQELVEALEILTAQHPLLLVLEDLHWSDYATLDLLAVMARRREPARLLVLGTYRPVDAVQASHPVHTMFQELQRHALSTELRLDYLSEASVMSYMASRCGGMALPEGLIHLLHRRTSGNPLFLTILVDDVIRQGILHPGEGQWLLDGDLVALESGVPESLRHLIERQLEQLSLEEQHILEAASVIGKEFSVAALAVGVEQSVEDVEARCTAWARRGQFVRACGMDTWPDGTVAVRYGFIHDLYRETFYERVPVSRRVRLHRQVGERLEVAYGAQAQDIAPELARHFVAGHDAARAIQYLQSAGIQALQRNAHQEALRHLSQALQILDTLPDTVERARRELAILTRLGPGFIATRGYASAEVATTYTRARDLGQRLGDNQQLFLALRGLWNCYLMRTEVQNARSLGEQLFQLALQARDPTLLIEAHRVMGTTLFMQGEFLAAHQHLQEGIALYDRQQHQLFVARYGADPGVTCQAYAARNLLLLGYPEQARQQSYNALHLARELGHAFSIGFAQIFLSDLLLLQRAGLAAQEQAEAVLTLARDYGFPHWVALGVINKGWSLVEQGQWEAGIQGLTEGLEAWESTGARLEKPLSLAPLAAALSKVGRVEEGLRYITEALAIVTHTGERWWEAELHRLQGELEFRRASVDLAKGERCLHQALTVARQQQARFLELRAAMSLGRLWQQQHKETAARQLLEEIFGWFTEGFDLPDLQEAAALLTALGGQVQRPVARDQNAVLPPPSQVPPMLYRSQSGTPGASGQTAQPDDAVVSIFRQEGEYWTLTFQGNTCRVKDIRGLHYLAHLLRYPQRDVSALELARTDAGEAPMQGMSRKATTALATQTLEGLFRGAGEALDKQAKAAYKQRLADLHQELAEAQSFHDIGRSATIQAEIDFLMQELSRSLGLGGRARQTASAAERARVNVTRAIKAAMSRIAAGHPALGEHLTRSIKTGYHCTYSPDKADTPSWRF